MLFFLKLYKSRPTSRFRGGVHVIEPQWLDKYVAWYTLPGVRVGMSLIAARCEVETKGVAVATGHDWVKVYSLQM